MRIFTAGYFMNNLGDDLFLKILLEKYPNCKFVIIAGHNYKNKFPHKNLIIINTDSLLIRSIRFICRKIGRMDLFYRFSSLRCQFNIFIGGSLFIESNNLQEQIHYYKDIISNKKKSFLLGSNFGPYKTSLFKTFFRQYLLSFEDIVFRDLTTYLQFKENPNVRYVPDIVFNLKRNTYQIKTDNILSISVMHFPNQQFYKEYISFIVKAISLFKKKVVDGKIILIAFCTNEKDDIAVKTILDQLPDKKNVFPILYKSNIDEIIQYFAQSRFVIATRFHAMILGFLFNKATLPIVYNPKMSNVMDDLNYKGPIVNINNIENSEEKLKLFFEREENIPMQKIQKVMSEAINVFQQTDKFFQHAN